MILASLTSKRDKESIDHVTVTIKKTWPHNGGNSPYNYVVTDGSTEAKLSLFSKTGAPQLLEGQTYTLRPTVTTKGPQGLYASIYNGKHSINGDTQNTQIIQGDAAGADNTAQRYEPPTSGQTQATPETPTGKDAQKMVDEWAKLSKMTYDAYIAQGFNESVASTVAARAPELSALSWFGEKSCF